MTGALIWDYDVLHVALGVETWALLQAQIHEGKVYHDCLNLRQRPFYSSSRGIAPSNAPHAFLEGVRINTTATNAQAITQLKLRRWNGKVGRNSTNS
jgi:hypothetical protein